MGAIVNAITIIITGTLGLFLNKGIPQRVIDTIMSGIALAIIVMGIDGALSGENMPLTIIAIAVGSLLGEILDLDGRLIRGAKTLEERFVKNNNAGEHSFSEAFINATLVVCVGSMAIIGSLESGLLGDNTTIYIKSLIDGIFVFLLASSLGAGVIFSSIPVLIYQGAITLFAGLLAPLLTTEIVVELVAVGSLLLIALGMNMLEITKIRVMNMVPSMIIPIIVMPLLN